MKFLLGELTGKRPLMPQTLQTNAEQADVLNTFRTIAQLPGDSLGAYVISMARSASDVLAVVLLQVCISPLPTPRLTPLGPPSVARPPWPPRPNHLPETLTSHPSPCLLSSLPLPCTLACITLSLLLNHTAPCPSATWPHCCCWFLQRVSACKCSGL